MLVPSIYITHYTIVKLETNFLTDHLGVCYKFRSWLWFSWESINCSQKISQSFSFPCVLFLRTLQVGVSQILLRRKVCSLTSHHMKGAKWSYKLFLSGQFRRIGKWKPAEALYNNWRVCTERPTGQRKCVLQSEPRRASEQHFCETWLRWVWNVHFGLL